MQGPGRAMDRRLSVYLDFLRFAAAMAVFFSHASEAAYTSLMPAMLSDFGHDGVIIFFVLSGFVIAYVSERKEHTWRDFGLSRAARIYSVAVPAIALTIVLDAARTSMVPTLHIYQFHELGFYIPYWLAFGTDWWFFNETMLSNGPFWSLSYEVWYYIIFGALFYFRGWRRWIFAALALAIVGPRQWLLFPIWLAGCALYYRHERWPLRRSTARCLFFGSIVIYAALKSVHAYDAIDAVVNRALGGFPYHYLRYSQFFLSDYLIGVLAIINIYALRYCDFGLFIKHARPIRLAASFTFSLYLFHMPLLKFFRVAFGTDLGSFWAWVLLLAATLVSVVLLGLVTEWRKREVKRLLAASLSLLDGVRSKIVPARPLPRD